MNRPFKILFIFPITQIWGGEFVWLKFLENIDRKKFDPVCLVFGEGELIERLKRLKIRSYDLKRRRLRNIPYVFKNFFIVFSILRKERFDAVNSLGVHLLSFVAAIILRLPYCIHIHTIHPLPFIDRWCLKKASRIATPSNFSKNFLKWYGIKDELVDVIPNGIDIDAIRGSKAVRSIRDEFNLGDAVIVCYTGRIVPWKNLDKLIMAIPEIKLKYHKPVKFLFVGSTPSLKPRERGYGEALLDLSKRLKCREDLVFTGKREDVASILKETDIFVMPSLLEVCSMSILEAMCLARPVVAMKSGGNPEIITQTCGKLVDPEGGVSAISEAILELLNNENMRRQLGEGAAWRVSELFYLRENLKKFALLLEKIVLSRKGLEDIVRNDIFPESKISSIRFLKRRNGSEFVIVKSEREGRKSVCWIKIDPSFFVDIQKARKLSQVRFEIMAKLYEGFRDERLFGIVRPLAYIPDYAAIATAGCPREELRRYIIMHSFCFNPSFGKATEAILFCCGRMLARFQVISLPYKDKFILTSFSAQEGMEEDLGSLSGIGADKETVEKLKDYLFHHVSCVKEHDREIVLTHPDFGPRNFLLDKDGRLTLLDLDDLQARTSLEDVAIFLVRLELYLRYPLIDRARIERLKDSFLRGYQEEKKCIINKNHLRFWLARYLVASLAGECILLKKKNWIYRRFILKRSKIMLERWVKEEIDER